VLGLGNPILTDDGIGICVVHEAKARFTAEVPDDDVTFAEASVGGFRLLSVLTGYDRVLMVDAIQTPGGQPGDVGRLEVGSLHASLHSGCTHDLTLAGALALGRHLGVPLPRDDQIQIIAIEAEDVLTFGEQCTPAVEAAAARAVEMVLQELEGPAVR
jgi:hydrogenase maturation protease